MLKDKKIILAVSGSIAAYKAAYLTRLLIKSGAEVRVLMTESAKTFISPLTFATLSRHPVHIDVSSEASWNNHVEMGLWADAMVIAPATANTLAKMANGICDNMVTATYLSAKCPVFAAPAMDLDMWRHPATKRNLELLKSFGTRIIPVAHGELASGLVGDGRMAEPETILAFLEQALPTSSTLSGLSALVTAGPTYEPIDPVRFVGNHASGKMGVALAAALAKNGARVYLILGPSKEAVPEHPLITLTRVQTAEQMYEAAKTRFEDVQIAILAAAVADYRPLEPAQQKIKKKADNLVLNLEKTTDIAAQLGKQKKEGQTLIGFALETENALEHGLDKLRRKNFDFIVVNSLADAGAGFNYPTNKITILDKNGGKMDFPLKSKDAVADDILQYYVQNFR